jgi:hypothetical protein
VRRAERTSVSSIGGAITKSYMMPLRDRVFDTGMKRHRRRLASHLTVVATGAEMLELS